MAGIIYKMVPDYYEPYNKYSILILTDGPDYKDFICCENYCVATHNEFCDQFSGCKFHILLCLTSPHNVVDQLKHLHFKYTEVSDIYSFYQYYIHRTLIASNGTVTSDLHRALEFYKGQPSILFQPSVLKKKVKRRVFKTHTKSNLVKTASTQTVEDSLQKRISTILESRYCSDFYKIVDAFCDHHGSFETNNVVFMLNK